MTMQEFATKYGIRGASIVIRTLKEEVQIQPVKKGVETTMQKNMAEYLEEMATDLEGALRNFVREA